MDFTRFSDPSQPAINAWARDINAEAIIAGVPPCALAAIVDNETDGRNILQEGMPAGPGAGVGLCQITAGVDWSNPDRPTYETYNLWDPAQNLYVAAAYFLAPAIADAARLQREDLAGFSRWGNGQVLWYAFAAYNEGWGGVYSRYAQGLNPDDTTTNGYAQRAYAAYIEFLAASRAQGMTPK